MRECFKGHESRWEGLFVPYSVAPDGYAFQVLEIRPPLSLHSFIADIAT